MYPGPGSVANSDDSTAPATRPATAPSTARPTMLRSSALRDCPMKPGPHPIRQPCLGPVCTVRARPGPFRPVKTASSEASGPGRARTVANSAESALTGAVRTGRDPPLAHPSAAACASCMPRSADGRRSGGFPTLVSGFPSYSTIGTSGRIYKAVPLCVVYGRLMCPRIPA